MANYKANQNIKNGIENGNGNGNDNENGNDNGNGNGSRNGNGSGNGNGNGYGNGNGNRNGVNGNVGGIVQATRECTYKEFLNCQPLNFKGTEGAVGLARWFEKMKSVFHIRNCSTRCQVKYATCTLLDGALTWWNCHKRTVRVDVANEIQKLENELWNLTVKGNDVVGYTQRFQELALLCPKIVLYKEEKIKRMWRKGHTKRHCPGLENHNGEEEARQNLDLVT
ncbi:putative reverse transcriptase domain-containing protein, partial [Tanacetum coccineum]